MKRALPVRPGRFKMWNANTSRASFEKVLTAWMSADQRPDLIGLNEVGDFFDIIARLAARFGYRVVQERPLPDRPVKPEHGSSCLLIDVRADDVEVEKTGHKVMKRRWEVFGYDRVHEPRRFPWAVVRIGGVRYRAMVVHLPTHGEAGGNRAAWLEAMGRLVAFISNAGPFTVPVVFGDVNEKAGVVRSRLAHLGGRVVGHHIDLLLSLRAKSRATRLAKNGSDHYAVDLVVEPRAAVRR